MHCNYFQCISTYFQPVHPGTFPVGHATWSWWADRGARRVEATATYGSALQMDRGWRWQWPPGKTFCLFMCGIIIRIPFAGRKWFLKKLLVVPSYVWNLPDTCCWATSYVFSTCRCNLSLRKIPRLWRIPRHLRWKIGGLVAAKRQLLRTPLQRSSRWPRSEIV